MNDPAQREKLVKALFSALRDGKIVNFNNRPSLNALSKELGIGGDQIKQWFAEWKTAPATAGDDHAFPVMAALLNDTDNGYSDSAVLERFALNNGLGADELAKLWDERERYLEETSILRRAVLMRAALGRKAASGNDFYVANQVGAEGLDEIQRLLLAYKLGVHVAIDGPPGVGKTRGVIEVARILGRTLFTKTCSNRTTESHIISHPALTVRDGASVTEHVNGPLLRAMTEPGIFYGDEFNLLKEDVQKRLNSAFDERRSIDRSDGEEIEALPGFWAVISYNPSQDLVSRDLEDSVADRFAHFHFQRWRPDFKAFVSAAKAGLTENPGNPQADGSAFNVKTGWRGVDADLNFYRGTVKGSGPVQWEEFFTSRPASRPAYVYRVYDPHSLLSHEKPPGEERLNRLDAQAYNETELARLLSRFTDLLQSLAHSGHSPLLKKIGLADLREKDDLELLSLHESSTRIEAAALKHYRELLHRGCRRYLAQSYAANLVIDQVCYGRYRNKKLRENTVHSLVVMIARSMRLLVDEASYNTKLVTQSLLE